jgi:hypothetical protein
MNGMKNILSTFKHAHQRGGRYYAIVEHIRLGLCTVRLKANGARLTNLHVVGNYVSEGDLVVVDYGGMKPVVKPTDMVVGEVSLDMSLADSLEIQRVWEGQDHGVAAYNTGNQTVPYNTWTPVVYNSTQWDTDNFWNPGTPERLTAPNDGYYLILFAWAWEKTGRIEYEDWNAWEWNYSGSSISPIEANYEGFMNNFVRIVHSVDGEIFRGADMKPLRDIIDTKDSLFLSVEMNAGDFVYAEALTRNPYNESRTLIGSSGKHPRLVMQHRFDL